MNEEGTLKKHPHLCNEWLTERTPKSAKRKRNRARPALRLLGLKEWRGAEGSGKALGEVKTAELTIPLLRDLYICNG